MSLYAAPGEVRLGYNDLLELLALRTGLGGFTPSGWTTGGVGFCNGNGFSARVCPPGGWGPAAADYECGRVPPNVSIPNTPSDFYGDPLGLGVLSCKAAQTVCACFPGFYGPQCNATAASASRTCTTGGPPSLSLGRG